jgi:protease IV
MRDFLKHTFASFLGLVLFVTLGLGGLLFLVATIASVSNRSTAIKDDTILAFDLSLDITDSTPSQGLTSILSGSGSSNTISLRTVIEAIDRAAKDSQIAGLYLHGDMSGGSGFASLQEVRQALERFRATGKPILAYEMQGGERDYYLTSVANPLMLNPNGALTINGFRSETMFLAGAFQKYGVGVQILRVGRYKSAVEQYVRTNNSPEARQETQQLLNDLWREFLNTTAKSRKITPQQIQAIANKQGMLLADQALSARLIDKIAYPDEVAAALRSVTGEKQPKGAEEFRQISLPDYADATSGDRRWSGNHIAILYAEGDIVSGEGSPGQVGGDQLAEQLRRLRQKDDVKAIVLRVDSPGGSAAASDQVAREVKLTAQQKPVIISMGNYAASGGYLISTYGTQIFASPNTITGSIGVFGVLFNFQQIANRNGITWDVTETAPFADSETIARPKTPQELAIGQRMVNQIYDRFVGTVAESRSLPKNQVNEIAQGRVWSGIEAQKVGLVDHLGGLEDAIQAAARQADLGSDWQLEEYPKSRGLEEKIFNSLFSARLTQLAAPPDPLSIELQKLRSELETLKSMNDPLGAYMRLPFNSRID